MKAAYLDSLFVGEHLNKSEIDMCDVSSFEQIERQQEICQLLKDLTCTNEGLGGANEVDMKYTALQCTLISLKDRNPSKFEYLSADISSKQLNANNSKKPFQISNIYQIERVEEQQFENYRREIGNINEYMFHGTSPANLLGILRRGMILPSEVSSWYYKGKRRDQGMLGAGLYYTDDFYSAAKYSTISNGNNRRYILVSDVALGNTFQTTLIDTSLTKAPKGFHSVLGKRIDLTASPPVSSNFEDDEYVVYNTKQQSLKYLVEFYYASDPQSSPVDENVANIKPIQLQEVLKQELFKIEQKKLDDLERKNSPQLSSSEVIPIEQTTEKVFNSGLYSSTGSKLPLKSTHLRGKILDVIGQIYVFQQFTNDTNQAIEAKYLFPLDEMGAVCGFEAFINGKHIIGHVEEKKKARKEYKEAIAKGHGAYLMEQELPDCWTVSVGNLPPYCTVYIKISYVTELQMDGDEVIFQFPSSLGGTAIEKSKHDHLQNQLESINMNNQDIVVPQTLQVGIEMPYDIDYIYSPTHQNDSLLFKYTATKATIALNSEKYKSLDGKDFVLRISLANAYHPRMWIEEQSNHHDNKAGSSSMNFDSYHKAAMLVFYPKFDFKPLADNEFLFIVDCSSSMKEQNTRMLTINLLKLLLAELPKNSLFNIICFGNEILRLFVKSENSSNEVIMNKAKEWIEFDFPDNLGGTDLYTVLHDLYLLVDTHKTPRNFFILSDGQFATLDSCLSLIQQNAEYHRVFGFGIGSQVSRYSIQSISRVGRGYAEFFNSASTSLSSSDQDKVKRQYQKAVQPTLSNVNCIWNSQSKVDQSPAQIFSLFNGQRLVIYGMLDQQIITMAKLSCKADDGEMLETSVATSELAFTRGDFIHKLAARSLLRDFEEGILLSSTDDNEDSTPASVSNEIVKAQKTKSMIELSCKYNVVFSLTSFLAIEERTLEEQNRLKLGAPTPLPMSIKDLYEKEHVDLLDYILWGFGVEERESIFLQKKEEEKKALNITRIENLPEEKARSDKAVADLPIEEDSTEEVDSNHPQLNVLDTIFEEIDSQFTKKIEKKPHIVVQEKIIKKEEERSSTPSFLRLFGKKKEVSPVVNTIDKLHDYLSTINKRKEFIEKKIEKEMQTAKKFVGTNKKGTIELLIY